MSIYHYSDNWQNLLSCVSDTVDDMVQRFFVGPRSTILAAHPADYTVVITIQYPYSLSTFMHPLIQLSIFWVGAIPLSENIATSASSSIIMINITQSVVALPGKILNRL